MLPFSVPIRSHLEAVSSFFCPFYVCCFFHTLLFFCITGTRVVRGNPLMSPVAPGVRLPGASTPCLGPGPLAGSCCPPLLISLASLPSSVPTPCWLKAPACQVHLPFSVQETEELSGLLTVQVLLLARLQQGCDVSCGQERVRLLPVVLPLRVCGCLGEQSPWRAVLLALSAAPSSHTAAPGGALLCHPGDAQTGRTQCVTWRLSAEVGPRGRLPFSRPAVVPLLTLPMVKRWQGASSWSWLPCAGVPVRWHL